MISKKPKQVIPIVVLTLFLGATRMLSAQTQWSGGAYGVAEYDTKQTILLLGGASFGPSGMGLKPRIGAQAYYLAFDVGAARENGYVVKPFVGLVNNYNGGEVGGNIGYAFSNNTIRDVGTGTALTTDAGEGIVVSGGLEEWGTGGPLGYQALASYNFKSEGLWTRGRVTTRLSQVAGTRKQIRVGPEVAYLHGKDYWGVQPGGVVQFYDGQGRILALGAGAKFFQGNQNAAYFKVEGYLPLPLGR
jgi:hypothetical protein